MNKPDASRRSRVTTVLLAAAVLIGAANIGAYATTGFSIGHRTVSGKTTTFVNHGSGPVIALKGRMSSAPMKVNSKKKVAHLNADRVDGRNAASLANTAITYGLPTSTGGGSVSYTFGGLPAGAFLISYSVNRQLKATGNAAPKLACTFLATSVTRGQLTDVTAPDTHATANASGVLRIDPTATLRCTTNGGNLVADASGPLSTISFLKVDRAANGTANTAKAVVGR